MAVSLPSPQKVKTGEYLWKIAIGPMKWFSFLISLFSQILVHKTFVSFVLVPCRFTGNHLILHPGAVRVIMTLLPSVFSPEDPQVHRWKLLSLHCFIQYII